MYNHEVLTLVGFLNMLHRPCRDLTGVVVAIANPMTTMTNIAMITNSIVNVAIAEATGTIGEVTGRLFIPCSGADVGVREGKSESAEFGFKAIFKLPQLSSLQPTTS